ncbi:hypothetical protein K1W69_24480 [Hoeflea sp. WL0058]|uniref:Uncharacterized protein n=1 Tax=Flavimaribacter sediminis TaxID=2865987 RepID=A0AAE3D417_9HYPH|nr:hypothetical protein [Flavimaribacter sediminis]MBW8640371.1 hypothetical protein [Flavimaribacter sediminis]
MKTPFMTLPFLLLFVFTAHADTPRLRYIQTFNYYWDMKGERPYINFDAPFFGRFAMHQPALFYECEMFGDRGECHFGKDLASLKENWMYNPNIHEWSEDDTPWFTINPYTTEELFNEDSDWAYVPMCNEPFKTLPDDSVHFSDFDNPDFIKKFNLELQASETVFTDQFLSWIEADDQLTAEIGDVGLLSIRANQAFRHAWKQGRLKRPAIVLAVGECGAGEVSVDIKFREPTERLQLITDFDYLICEREGLDPWNSNECPDVRDSVQETELLAGKYRAKITRNSGKVLFREIEIDDFEDEVVNF